MYLIIEKRQLNPQVFLMKIEAPKIAKRAKAGQFVIIMSHENSERIPLTIACHDHKTITIIYQIVGASTLLLNELNENDELYAVVGPLGKASLIPYKKKVCIVGGGVGCAIAYPLIQACVEQECEVTVIVGFKKKEFVILENEIRQLATRFIMMSDDGSIGKKGWVHEGLADLLNKESFDEVMALGPILMMKSICELTKEWGIKTMVSMNPIMIDGTGMCGGCRLSVNHEIKFACVDGPDFNGHEVDFDSVLDRLSMYHDFEHHAYEKTCHLLNQGREKDE